MGNNQVVFSSNMSDLSVLSTCTWWEINTLGNIDSKMWQWATLKSIIIQWLLKLAGWFLATVPIFPVNKNGHVTSPNLHNLCKNPKNWVHYNFRVIFAIVSVGIVTHNPTHVIVQEM